MSNEQKERHAELVEASRPHYLILRQSRFTAFGVTIHTVHCSLSIVR
jgi:hypothetical protein